MPEVRPTQLDTEALRRRKQRNWLVFGLLLAFVIIIYVTFIVKTSSGG